MIGEPEDAQDPQEAASEMRQFLPSTLITFQTKMNFSNIKPILPDEFRATHKHGLFTMSAGAAERADDEDSDNEMNEEN